MGSCLGCAGMTMGPLGLLNTSASIDLEEEVKEDSKRPLENSNGLLLLHFTNVIASSICQILN